MTQSFDAAARLAQGRQTVADIQTCVWACQVLGYRDADLTAHPSQVGEWYGTEDGLDLVALDRDCTALRAVVAATQEALVRQQDQLAALSAAFRGRGADACREFLRRHGEASDAAAAAVRTAADALSTLRETLWRTVDGKVAATTAIDVTARPDWLAAARTVMTGAGDRVAASELVDMEVKPFVDQTIRSGWLPAMRAARDAVAAAYGVTAGEIAAERVATFDVPGDIGPAAPAATRAVTASGPVVFPAAPDALPAAPGGRGAPVGAQAGSDSFSVPPMPEPAAPVTQAPPAGPASTAPAGPAPPAVPSLGGALPETPTGAAGIGQWLSDGLGRLLGGADALPDAVGGQDGLFGGAGDTGDVPDDPERSEDEDGDEDGEPDDAPEDEPADVPDDPTQGTADQDDEAAAGVGAEPPADPSPAQPVATPVPVPPPLEYVTAPEVPPAGDARTACEIAADELPQAGP